MSFAEKKAKLTAASRIFVAHHGRTVRYGPFAGMEYIQEDTTPVLMTKLLGCYEMELHELLEQQVIPTGYNCIINIGSGEGYYTVGLARRMQNAKVFAYDIKASARKHCEKMAEKNGVRNRITVASNCGHKELKQVTEQSQAERTLIVCDAEGYELEILQPAITNSLRYCDLLVELHDFYKPGLSKFLLQRFERTHDLRIIASGERDHSKFKELHFLEENNRWMGVTDLRPARMEWVFMRSRSWE